MLSDCFNFFPSVGLFFSDYSVHAKFVVLFQGSKF